MSTLHCLPERSVNSGIRLTSMRGNCPYFEKEVWRPSKPNWRQFTDINQESKDGCLVVCSTNNHSNRKLQPLGHFSNSIPPPYVKAVYLKHNLTRKEFNPSTRQVENKQLHCVHERDKLDGVRADYWASTLNTYRRNVKNG